ncbi:hemocyanin AA6 chain-like [Limulus polyphemus]|uniref:Hemocyanin AA6 chain-like n=1 Tax=Limulus polyphemus TaxID=6850 RepID=A2AX57_LIMPO|nr:hemocyanin AA6 chain-like [Limulus polyphemus]CAJ91098.1 hemocyanin subunit IIIa [Limulus polyphemus]
MTVKEKQSRLLPLFKHLTSLTRDQLPVGLRDDRLKDVGHLPRGTLFSLFHAKHLEEATHLYEILYGAKDFDDLMHLLEQARNTVNEGMFVYAATVAVLHRDDCRGVTVPPIEEVFPDRFIPVETIRHADKEAAAHPDKDIVVEFEETGNILDPEYRLAYYREDVSINRHHWHWHIVYPATWRPEFMHKEKDRKGELFYYMHQQMCARYDCERLSNGMHRMFPFNDFHEELEGYSPHLTSLISGLNYGTRPDGLKLHDLHDVTIQDMERWRERIHDAIDLKMVHDHHGKEVAVDDEHGIDILGALVESSHESVNQGFYGSLHNWGHVLTARAHDPEGKFHENPGVMSDTSTSLRDPIFYRWHRTLDNLFQEYKESLSPYTKEELSFPGVEVLSATVKAKTDNVIITSMVESELELTHGINFGTDHSVKVKYNHLDHESFSYQIKVENTSGSTKHATVRVFLAPKYDELGNLLHPNDQRRLCIELDKFHKELKAGKNEITRNSVDSSVTISTLHTFDELESGVGVNENADEYCSCGWPKNMLVPRGNNKGMTFELFVMLTDWEHDNVGGKGSDNHMCDDAVSYCGAKDSKYPDKKPMGFPFDRRIDAHDIEEFLTPNMALTDVKIKFEG